MKSSFEIVYGVSTKSIFPGTIVDDTDEMFNVSEYVDSLKIKLEELSNTVREKQKEIASSNTLKA